MSARQLGVYQKYNWPAPSDMMSRLDTTEPIEMDLAHADARLQNTMKMRNA